MGFISAPAKLPEAARSVGRGMRELKESLSGDDDDEDESTTERAA
jgi:Sec-independent protein translocase protein TatA